MSKHGLLAGLGDDLYGMLIPPTNPDRVKDVTGQRFGRLIVLNFLGMLPLMHKGRKHTNAIFLCRCDCGKEVPVKGTDLRHGNVRSCSCMEWGYKQKRNPEYTKDVKRALVDYLFLILTKEQMHEAAKIIALKFFPNRR